MSLKIGIAGAAGRMGRAIAEAAAQANDMQVIAGIDQPGLQNCGHGSFPITPIGEASLGEIDVLIDFSLPAALSTHLNAARDHGCAMVIGVTGLSPVDVAAIEEAAQTIPIVQSGNMSLGVNLLAALVRDAGARLAASEYDIEVFESHHKRKVDAPSGTALLLGNAAAGGRQTPLGKIGVYDRTQVRTPRGEGDIGFSVMRGGGVIGDHTVAFLGDSEVVELSHKAIDRGLFAKGALVAARWVPDQVPGVYGMADVLGL